MKTDVMINGELFSMDVIFNDGYSTHITLSQRGRLKAQGYGSDVVKALADAYNSITVKRKTQYDKRHKEDSQRRTPADKQGTRVDRRSCSQNH